MKKLKEGKKEKSNGKMKGFEGARPEVGVTKRAEWGVPSKMGQFGDSVPGRPGSHCDKIGVNSGK